MRRKLSGTLALLASVMSADGLKAAGPPLFQGLGKLPGAAFGSSARAISDDGTAVTGNSDQMDIGGPSLMAFRWQAGMMIPLGDTPGGSDLSESGGISADGSAAGGMSFSDNGTEAFRWQNGVMVGIGDVAGGPFYSHGFDISGDGTTVVGLSLSAKGDAAFRWKDGVMIDVADDFPGGQAVGLARAVSHDGSVVVGMLSAGGLVRPFRWEGNLTVMLDIPAGSLWGTAIAVSPDGAVVVGVIRHSDDPFVAEAFRWQGGTMTLLGDLPGGDFQSDADDVSADGNVIVGNGGTATGVEPFVWTATSGMRRLRDVLVDDYNIDLAGWTLSTADGVSADGLTIAGTGVNPAGQQEAWIAHIGCAIAGDFNNDGLSDGGDIGGFVRCFTSGLGCGCGDFTADGVVDEADLGPFVEQLLGVL